MNKIEENLIKTGVTIPDATKPSGSYIPVVRTGNLLFTAGQGCKKDGVLVYKGKLGQDLTVKEGYEAAKISIINCLAILKAYLGDLNRIKQVVKLLGFVASAPGFDQQPYVMNGASEFLIELFGDKGKHARSAIGVNELPFGTPVEIEMVVEIN
jgi:enamine deaminase RidA (YjgF/YER057c/UK114 family)